MTVSLGIVGTGNIIAKSYLPVLLSLPNVKIAGLCDVDAYRLADAANMVPYPVHTTANHKTMLEDDAIDAFIIATPTDSHVQLAKEVCSTGKPVFLEKPLAPSLEEAVNVWRHVETNHANVQVAYVYRHSPLIRKMAALLTTGTLGDPVQMWAHEFRGAFYEAWRYQKHRSGGALLEKICHHADILNWFFQGLPQRVYAAGGQAVIKRDQKTTVRAVDGRTLTVDNSDVLDHAWLIAEFGDAASASLGMNLVSPYGIHGRDANDLESLEIGVLGTEGMAVCHVRQGTIYMRQHTTAQEHTIRLPAETSGWHSGTVEQFDAFVDAVRTQRPCYPSVREGVLGMLVPLAGEMSIDNKTTIDVERLAKDAGIDDLNNI